MRPLPVPLDASNIIGPSCAAPHRRACFRANHATGRWLGRSNHMRHSARKAAFVASMAATLLLGACTSTYVSPVDVTRFVGEEPALLGTGPIAVRAGTGMDPASLEYTVFQTAVVEELERLGYIVAGADALQVAEITVERFAGLPDGRRSPVNVGVGGSTGSYGSGVGVGIGLDLSGPPPERVDTELRVVIRPTAGAMALWEGRARFTATANSDMAEARASAEKLATALFAGFPGESGETIRVR